MRYYRRRRLDWWDELAALGIGVAAGAAAVYLARLWLQRDPLPRGGEERRPVRSGFEAGAAGVGESAPGPRSGRVDGRTGNGEETEEGTGGPRRG